MITLHDDKSLVRGLVQGSLESRTPVCILLAGSGVGLDGCSAYGTCVTRDLADALEARGFGSVRFAASVPPVCGSAADAYYLQPTQRILHYIYQEQVDAVPKFIIGHSLGGHVASYVSSRLQSLRGVVLLNPHVSSLRDMVQRQCTAFGGRVAPVLARSAHGLLNIHAAYFKSYDTFDAAKYMRDLKCPVLHVGCGRDSNIERSEYERVCNILKEHGYRYQTRWFPLLDHHLCMRGETRVSNSLVESIATWLSTASTIEDVHHEKI